VETIDLNGRTLSLTDIVAGTPIPATDFERHTLGFIRDWMTGAREFVLHTSGSTGAPKPIHLTRAQMTASAQATAQALGLQPGWTALVTLDTRFVAGKMMLVRSLITGMHIVAREPTANPLEKLADDQRIDFAALVPYQVETILQSPQTTARLGAISTIIIGGAPLSASTALQLASLPCRAYLTYGMTETISHIALQRLDPHTEPGIFEALPGITLDTDNRGCLVISAPYILQGQVVTNDRVEILAGREFRWLGRWDNVINSGGFKINPETIEYQIEKIFHRFKITNSFFVAGMPDLKLGEKLVLVIEGAAEEKLRMKIDEGVKTIARGIERPKSVVFIPQFTRTSTQKVNRKVTLLGHIGE
jgi:O-succinylbenzoic acid--CoA ligase